MVRWLIALVCAVGFLAGPLAPVALAATPIQEKHQSLGGSAGRLGAPVSTEICGLRDGGCYQRFEDGSIHWTRATGAQPTWGAIRTAWARTGYENGKLGYPTASEVCGLRGGGCYQRFQGGSVHWTRATGAQPTWGAIRTAWARTGYEKGALGYPKAAEGCAGGTCTQYFQRGWISWNSAAGIRMRLDIDVASSTSVVVNKRRPLSPAGYVTAPLVSVEGQLLRNDAAAQAQRLISDARAAGVPMTAVSAYRSYQTQATLYNNYVAQYGQATADTISARPGHSEHQTGLAVDIGNPNGACALQACFAGTPAGTWAANNAWRYGFIVRYPQGMTNITGYAYEPWHLRYVGTLISAEMRAHGIPTLEQYMGLPAAPNY